jgi:diadenosine tetraphosphate (Ap4A) HIT family hydrolase
VSTYLENCKLCALLQQEKNVTRIADFSTGIAFVNFDQTYPGRSMLVVRPHYDSLLDIPSQLTSPFMEDIKLLSRAIQAAFHPPLINYLMLGNTVLHAHCHVVPRYQDAPRWRLSPLLPAPGEYKKQTDEHYRQIAEKIRIELPNV